MKTPYASRCRNLTGLYGPILTPGSDAWMRTMSASKVAAVLGLSPYMSRFTLWHQMNGTAAKTETTEVMRRGHYLEPAVSAWFSAQHPDWKIIPTGTWTHPRLSWATASPDRIALIKASPAALVEIKTAGHSDGWTDSEIPPGYRAQVMWAMHVTGATTTYVAVLLPFLEFREYLIRYDAAEGEFIERQCEMFMDTLARQVPPPLDGATSTYQTLRELHPEINGESVEVSPEIAEDFLYCKRVLGEAEELERASKSHMLARMGNAKTATCNGVVIATRAAKNGGTPYLSYPRVLPAPGDLSVKESA